MTRWTNTGLLATLLLAGVAFTPAPAQASSCNPTLLDCDTAAAKIDDFWYRTAAALDCEVDYAACLRDVLLAE